MLEMTVTAVIVNKDTFLMVCLWHVIFGRIYAAIDQAGLFAQVFQ